MTGMVYPRIAQVGVPVGVALAVVEAVAEAEAGAATVVLEAVGVVLVMLSG